MSAAFSFIVLLLFYFLRPIGAAASCLTSKFICGNTTLDIEYPFFTNTTTSPVCPGLYLIHCLNLTPMIQFSDPEFLYPVKNISYTDRILIIDDVKLSLSPYPWGPDCVFLYRFATPIPRFNVTQLSLLLISGQFHFDCRMSVFVSKVLDEIYPSPVCKDYTLHYTYQVDSQPSEGLPANCSTSGPFRFAWKLSFGRGGGDGGGLSLLSAGFSRSWERQLDCFDCQITVGGCNDGGGANSECRGSNSKKKNNNIIIAAASAAAVGFVLAGALGFLCYRHKKRRQPIPASTPLFRDSSFKSSFTEDPEFGKGDYQTHIFSYHELQEATDHFNADQELGDGGYGTVYKGKLRDGRTVAVKRLYDSNFKRVEQFINEVAILSRLRHQNLVNLYGCTSRQSRELLLVYEFVSNGTVADHIHGPRAAEGGLSWPRRISIAVETAEALAYLHAVEPPIIHRDVKTNNILLDDGFHVKVADFGLSRLVPTDATHVSTAPQGTPGYLDPEYYQCYQLTDKSDVYSFGVVLVELISSKQAVDVSRGRNEINLATMAVNRIQKRELEELVDPGLGYESDWEMRRVITVVAELAFRCLQMDRDMRPPIKEVLEVLRAVQSGAYKSGEDDVGARDDVGLLKNTGLFSPDTVTEKWASRSTTPNSSG